MSYDRTSLNGQYSLPSEKGYVLHHGDYLEVLKTLADNSIDAVVTDPPYGLEFMSVAWDTFSDRPNGNPRTRNEWEDFGSREHPRNATESARIAAKKNNAFQEFSFAWARECLRVLKPGGHLASFGGTRTYHRMTCAIEDSGFEIRDCIFWCYGSGFPKSLNVSKAIDKAAGAEREVVGFQRAGIARSSREGGEIVGGTAVEALKQSPVTAPATDAGRQWEGFGTSLKPAVEPICLARKPLSEKTVAANVLRWGTGAINVDGCRVGAEGATKRSHQEPYGPEGRGDQGGGQNWRTGHAIETLPLGRFPANLCHDGSDEVLDLFPESKSGGGVKGNRPDYKSEGLDFQTSRKFRPVGIGGDSGSAARFFYSAKASKADRAGSKHPTVKPIKLMQWLCRLITPPGGIVLDPFAGSGTTGAAAVLEGFNVVLIEREDEYIADIRNRMASLYEPSSTKQVPVEQRAEPQSLSLFTA